MAGYALKHILQGLILIWLMSVVAFAAIFALGNPLASLISPTAPPDVVARVTAELGLDLPLHEQYLRFAAGLLHGDFGTSYMTSQPALGLILERFPATIELTGVAMVIAATLGLPLGLYAGYRPGSLVGRASNVFAMLLLSLPSFWVALALIIVFAIETRLLPTGGRGELGTVLGITTSLATVDGWKHVLLPAINLAVFPTALFIRLTASGTQDALRSAFVRFARAKGLSTRRILTVYVLRSIVVPIITVVGIVLGVLLAFAVVTETIFAWPGSGRLIIDSIRSSDRPVVIAYLMFTATIFVIINFTVDLLCAFLDPRISIQKAR
jgi:peptide/nickel transport system permease protein